MPPKASQSSGQDTPGKEKSGNSGQSNASPKKATPRKKEPQVFTAIDRDVGVPIPVDVSFEGNNALSQVKKNIHVHTLKLEATSQFELIQTIVLDSGPYQGHQAIIVKPAKAFPFLNLPKDIQVCIYKYYFAPKGVVGDKIVLESKRSSNKDVFAKSYADGSKFRVGLLAAHREIYADAIHVLYEHALKFESTATLLDFLGQAQGSVRARLTRVHINSWVKTSSRNAMAFLAESVNLQELIIGSSFYAEQDTAKAAKNFYAEAERLLKAIGNTKKDPLAAVRILKFGKSVYTAEQAEQFREQLRAKLKSMEMTLLWREGNFRAYGKAGQEKGKSGGKEQADVVFDHSVERMLLGM